MDDKAEHVVLDEEAITSGFKHEDLTERLRRVIIGLKKIDKDVFTLGIRLKLSEI